MTDAGKPIIPFSTLYIHLEPDGYIFVILPTGEERGWTTDQDKLFEEVRKAHAEGLEISLSTGHVPENASTEILDRTLGKIEATQAKIVFVEQHPAVNGYLNSYTPHLWRAIDAAQIDVDGLTRTTEDHDSRYSGLEPGSPEFQEWSDYRVELYRRLERAQIARDKLNDVELQLRPPIRTSLDAMEAQLGTAEGLNPTSADKLPSFKYHPDPVASGVFIKSDETCKCCGKSRGYIYEGPVFSIEELSNQLCPWCIADGSAAAKYDAEFTDSASVGTIGDGSAIGNEILDEVTHRTPGFSGWQQEQWYVHCGDAAEFIGRAGAAEVLRHGESLLDELIKESGYDESDKAFIEEGLDSEGSPAAYLFRCRKCRKVGGYIDCD